jgi:hypothetical protein
MARVTIESQAAPAAQGPLETQLQEAVVLASVLGALAAVMDPGIMLGAAVAGAWIWLHQPSARQRVVCAVLIALPLLALQPFVVWGWPWRGWLASTALVHLSPVDGSLALRSFYTEALAGPLWLEGALLVARLRRRTVHAQVRRDHRLDKRRWRAIREHAQPAFPARNAKALRADISPEHPLGRIRIGRDLETNTALDLELPSDLAAHVFLPGASGSGKTNTIARLADGALACGYGLAVIDCKAGGLGNTARKLALRYDLPFYLVNPDDPSSLGYNPCNGDAPSVANKVVGTFTFAPGAEIYKNIAMETVAVAVRGLQATSQPVTLDSLYDAFGSRGLAMIAQKVTTDDRLRARLLALEPRNGDRLGIAGRTGLQRRLGALLEGKFGNLFRTEPALDWDNVVSEQSVAYVALSALASSEDVDLMGRVIVQDLKQLCARRLQQLAEGFKPQPLIVVLDEFAALDEPEQLLDLLRQAREALVSIVISTQHMPETVALQAACLGAGLLIVHRVATEDAQIIAAQFGTRPANDLTHQMDYANGFAEKGSVRRIDRYNVHPNEFRELTPGQVALKSVSMRQYTIARIYRDRAHGSH